MKNSVCKSCSGTKFNQILDLNLSPPSNRLTLNEELYNSTSIYPLRLIKCSHCHLIQLDYFFDSSQLFDEQYPYLSSVSTYWVSHCKMLLKNLFLRKLFNKNSNIIEIASNDGYLQDIFKNEYSLNIIGVEPTLKPYEIAKSKGHTVHKFFFNNKSSKFLRNKYGKFDLVIANNVFAHIPNLNDFTFSIKHILNKKGVAVIEVPYFKQALQKSLYDTVYHEHYYYYTLTSLLNLFKLHKLNFFDVEEIPTHGGSLRVFISKDLSISTTQNLKKKIIIEKNIKLNNLKNLIKFQNKTNKHISNFINFLEQNFKKGNLVIGVGSAAKATTILNYGGITRRTIQYMTDNASSKIGKFIPGSNIPIITLTNALKLNPKVLIIFPWNIFEELKSEILDLSKKLNLKVPKILSVRDKFFLK